MAKSMCRYGNAADPQPARSRPAADSQSITTGAVDLRFRVAADSQVPAEWLCEERFKPLWDECGEGAREEKAGPAGQGGWPAKLLRAPYARLCRLTPRRGGCTAPPIEAPNHQVIRSSERASPDTVLSLSRAGGFGRHAAVRSGAAAWPASSGAKRRALPGVAAAAASSAAAYILS